MKGAFLMEEPGHHEAVIIIGPPGVGKTPVREAVAERGYLSFDFSDAIREVARPNEQLWAQVKSYTERGELIPDDLALHIFDVYFTQKVLSRTSFVVSGFPRTIRQVEFLLPGLHKRGYRVTTIFADAEDLICVKRTAQRRHDQEQRYRVDPKPENRPRRDDLPEVHADRLGLYRKIYPHILYKVRQGGRFPIDRVFRISTVPPKDVVMEKTRSLVFSREEVTR